jgi:uncharacterized protein (DUF2141 family)
MGSLVKFFVFLLCSQLAQSQITTGTDVQVVVENIKSNNGAIYMAIYNTEASFLKTEYKGAIVQIDDHTCRYTFKNIPKGVYAISLFHDENDNGTMDTNFVGIPKEAYGCSNNAKGFVGPPKWKDAKFEIKDQVITQTITL